MVPEYRYAQKSLSYRFEVPEYQYRYADRDRWHLVFIIMVSRVRRKKIPEDFFRYRLQHVVTGILQRQIDISKSGIIYSIYEHYVVLYDYFYRSRSLSDGICLLSLLCFIPVPYKKKLKLADTGTATTCIPTSAK